MMLNEFKDAVAEITRNLFGRGSPAESWIFSAVFVIAVVLVFKLVAGILTGSKGRSLMVLFPSSICILAGAAAVRAFYSDSLLCQTIAAVIVLLFVAIPLTQAIQETSYFSAFLVWTVIMLTVIGVFNADSSLSGVIRKGAGRGSVLQQHRYQIDEVFKGTWK